MWSGWCCYQGVESESRWWLTGGRCSWSDEATVGGQEKVTEFTTFCLRPESSGGGQMGHWGFLHCVEMPKAAVSQGVVWGGH